jgi:uncharacterized protein YbjT (DUF2867 family)
METSTIMVAGATGLLGNEICRLLRAKHLTVKAMVRTTSDPVKTEQLTKLGVQLFQGDLRKKQTLDQVKTIFSQLTKME